MVVSSPARKGDMWNLLILDGEEEYLSGLDGSNAIRPLPTEDVQKLEDLPRLQCCTSFRR